MTPPRGSYPDVSSPVTAAAPAGGTLARQFTEPLRELSVLALLAGNAVFLFLGFSDLFFVIDGWASGFGARCAQVFPTFVGPVALGLPIAAMLLATHVAPMVRRSRPVLITVLSELGVSVLFGAITFLGGFAHDLSSARATIENTLWRIIWLGFLVLASVLAVRLWMGLYPAAKPVPNGYGTPSYGRPYPGQPMYTQPVPTYPAGTAVVGSPPPPPPPPAPASGPAGLGASTSVTGWPLVPPPPMPEPLVVGLAEPTQLIAQAPPPAGELTQPLPPTGELRPVSPPADAASSQANGAQAPVEVEQESAAHDPDVEEPARPAMPEPTSAEPATAPPAPVSGEGPTQQIQR